VIITHDKQEYPAIKCNKLDEMYNICEEYDVIGIDEGQFFEKIEILAEYLANKGKVVYIAALSGNYKREMFLNIIPLISKSDKILHLTSICVNCLKEASFTDKSIGKLGGIKDNENRSINLDVSSEDGFEEYVIGGSDIYMALCRKCYIDNKKEKESRFRLDNEF
jgi:thymidine kinase